MYSVNIKPDLWKKFHRMLTKDPKQFGIIVKKVEEILRDPHRYKNLRTPHQDWMRVKIQYKFVLIFSVDDENNTVTLEEYEHRDKVYRR